MTIQSYKLTGNLPIVDAVDGATKWHGSVRLDDEHTNIELLVLDGGIEPPAQDPAPEPAGAKGKTAPKE